ncbi:MAG: c-type cytochrome [Pseudomonadales bacterium]|nr:c-type cytochrome [Pseudomonadales bacterium]
MSLNNQRGGLLLTLLAGGAVSVGIIVGSVWMLRQTPQLDDKGTEVSVEYGRQLIRETSVLMGPEHEDPAMRYSGSNLDCSSCHLDSGTKPGTLSLLTASSRYPRFSGRDGIEGDLRDRINGCMERSMNGTKLPRESAEMRSMEAYILSLGEQYAAMGETRRQSEEPTAFREPARAADPVAGQVVYEERCQVCHGDNGQGLPATLDIREGYLFPPLWGPDSFNNGAGMNRVLTASNFIKARMPLGQPDLTDDEAYDVAAYINSKERPQKANLEVDYPDRKNKPVDSPYGPYADPFPPEQHRVGPYGPIREFYRGLE